MQRIIPLLFPTNWLKANPDYTDYLPIPKELVSLDVMGKQANASVEWAQHYFKYHPAYSDYGWIG